MKKKFSLSSLLCILLILPLSCLAIEGVVVCDATIASWSNDASMREYMSTVRCDCRNGNNHDPVCTPIGGGAAPSAGGGSHKGSSHQDTQMMMMQQMQQYLQQVGANNKRAFEESAQAAAAGAQALNQAQQSDIQSEEDRRKQAALAEIADREQGNQELGAQLQGMPGSEDRPTLDLASALNRDSQRNQAGDQLKSVKFHSETAERLAKMNGELSGEAAKDEASKGFDTGGKYAGSIPVMVPAKERVIPKEKITPEIQKIMDDRKEVKEKRIELEKDLTKLEAKKEKTPEDTVEMAKLKQDISTAKNKENYDDYAINEELEKPATSKTEK